jgi:hypothetical protein
MHRTGHRTLTGSSARNIVLPALEKSPRAAQSKDVPETCAARLGSGGDGAFLRKSRRKHALRINNKSKEARR